MSKVPFEAIVKTLKAQMPDAIIELGESFDGFQQKLVALTLTTSGNTTACFLKCFLSHASWWTANLQSVYNREISTIHLLNSSSVSAPNILASGETDGVCWILLEAIDGNELEDDPLNFDPDKLGQYVAQMHEIDVSGLSLDGVSTFDMQYVEGQMRDLARQSGCPMAGVDELSAIAKRFSESSELVFCHGDLHLGNILVSKSGEITAFDLEESIIGYRQYDVAELALDLQQSFGDVLSQQFVDAYSRVSGKQFPANFTDDWRNFRLLRNRIVGLYMNSLKPNSGLPFSKSFVDDNAQAQRDLANPREFLSKYQQKRVAIEKATRILKKTLGEDEALIEKIEFDSKQGRFRNVVAPEAVIQKLQDADLLTVE